MWFFQPASICRTVPGYCFGRYLHRPNLNLEGDADETEHPEFLDRRADVPGVFCEDMDRASYSLHFARRPGSWALFTSMGYEQTRLWSHTFLPGCGYGRPCHCAYLAALVVDLFDFGPSNRYLTGESIKMFLIWHRLFIHSLCYYCRQPALGQVTGDNLLIVIIRGFLSVPFAVYGKPGPEAILSRIGTSLFFWKFRHGSAL